MPYNQNTFIPIQDKIFKIEHIRELAELLLDEYQIKKQQDSQGVEFSVKCFDNTSFTGDDLTLFAPKSPILKKRLRSVELNIHPGKNTFVKVGVFHGVQYDSETRLYSNASFMELGSQDTMWVNGFAGKLEEWLDGIPDQENVLQEKSTWILWAAFIIGTYLFGMIIDWIHIREPEHLKYWVKVFNGEDVINRILAASFFGGGIFLAIIKHQIGKSPQTWPMVELQVGPDHLMMEKRKRNFLYKVWAWILLPILISIVSAFFI